MMFARWFGNQSKRGEGSPLGDSLGRRRTLARAVSGAWTAVRSHDRRIADIEERLARLERARDAARMAESRSRRATSEQSQQGKAALGEPQVQAPALSTLDLLKEAVLDPLGERRNGGQR